MDPYYTPSTIADKMIKEATCDLPSYIADFAAGDGDLLKAAHLRWPNSQIVGTDLCLRSVSFLRRTEPKWLIGKCDFLDPNSRGRCKALTQMEGKVCLILLNPPFSCRGGKYWVVNFKGIEVRCSLALAFVLNALSYLAPNGQIVAVLPAGCLQSEKDMEAWSLLRTLCDIQLVGVNGHKTFRDCFPRTVIVRLSLADSETHAEQSSKGSKPRLNGDRLSVKIIRGKVQMHTVDIRPSINSDILIHSTELTENGLDLSQRQINKRTGGICGPAVLLPRVGQPSKAKIVLYTGKQKVILSDCVIALKCRTSIEAAMVRSIITENWAAIEQAYGGTCAKYITLKSIAKFLEAHHFNVKIESSPRSSL